MRATLSLLNRLIRRAHSKHGRMARLFCETYPVFNYAQIEQEKLDLSELTQYEDAAGAGPLRDAVAELAGKRYGVALNRDNVCITQGASHGLFVAVAVAQKRCKMGIVPRPSFPGYRDICQAFSLPVRPYSSAQFSDPVARGRLFGDGPAVAIVNSPANPTGAVCTREQL